jgi:hypothetical protein
MRILKNCTKLGIPYYLVLIWNCTKLRTALIETELTRDSLDKVYTEVKMKKESNTIFDMKCMCFWKKSLQNVLKSFPHCVSLALLLQ